MQLHRTIPAVVILICGSMSSHSLPTAAAQSPTANFYPAKSAPSPTVSPYLNLAVDANGNSNYSSLVRPMLVQRELLAKQAADEQLQSRSRFMPGRPSVPTAQTGPQRERVSGTFMNYSHYFGGPR